MGLLLGIGNHISKNTRLGSKVNSLNLALDYPLSKYKYDSEPETTLILANTLTGWEPRGEISLDTEIQYKGEPTVRFRATAYSPYSWYTFPSPVDLSGYNYIELIVYVNDLDIAKPSVNQNVYLRTTSTDYYKLTNLYNFLINDNFADRTAGWRLVRFPMALAEKIGNGDLTNVVNIFVQWGAISSSIIDFRLAQINLANVTKGQLYINFDDGYVTTYTEAYPIMSARNLVGSSYIITDRVGESGRMNLSQMRELQSAGWMIGNHTSNHLYFTTDAPTESEIETAIKTGRDYLRVKGFWKSAYFLATPGGEENPTSRAVCERLNVMTRTSNVTDYIPIYPPDNHCIAYKSATSSYTLATFQNIIDNVVNWKVGYHLTFHMIDTSGASIAVTPALFEQVMDYVKTKVDAGVLDVITPINQYLEY